MININNKKIMQYMLNKEPKAIKNGDIVQYALMRQIDNNKAIINIMGNKVVAIFKNGIIDKGFALVEKVEKDNMFTLSIIKDAKTIEEAKENIKNNKNLNDNILIKKENDDITTLLVSRNIKPSEKNILYIETILKYLPNINSHKKNFILTSLSNEIYFTVEELRMLNSIFDKLIAIKNSNIKNKITEILFTLLDNNDIKEYVDNNGYFAILSILFDSIKEDLSNDEKSIFILLLKVLSSNKKKRGNKENTFLIPIPIIINNEVKELSLYIFKDYENNSNTKFTFIVYDDDNKNDICNIDIKKEYDYYIIRVLFFDKRLYYKLNEINIYSKLKEFDNIKLEMEYLENYEKK